MMLTPREIFLSEEPKFKEATQAILTGRKARCYCGNERDSSLDLAFFEFLGPGSDIVHTCNTCGKFDFVHWPINPSTGRAGETDHKFIPKHPLDHDRYYCGCRGWD
jgi:hypothetical protein